MKVSLILISLLVAVVLCYDDDTALRKADYTLTLQDKQDLLVEITAQGGVNPYFVKKWVYPVDVVVLGTFSDLVDMCSSIDPTGYPHLCLYENSLTYFGPNDNFNVPLLSSIAAYQKKGYDLLYLPSDYYTYDIAILLRFVSMSLHQCICNNFPCDLKVRGGNSLT
eukprot:TRINITY_DN2113_c1_g1_i2.p1 TRINITY_DN2113_c1_g1~~TRINITY_DN2113_c1_g1_i2.p1  ORF type:complete len:166 (+),score=23.01 TRINITY_DN2113_c1_g1_i2:81-578(+)